MPAEATKEGKIAKLSGWAWKSWSERYLRLRGNRLEYYVREGDELPKNVVDLDGAAMVEGAAAHPTRPLSSYPYVFSVTQMSTIPPHSFVFAAPSEDERDEWLGALQLASELYRCVMYCGVARDMQPLLDAVEPRWRHRIEDFRSIMSNLLDQVKFRIDFLDKNGYRRSTYTRGTHKAFYVVDRGVLCMCVVDVRVAPDCPAACTDDLHERFFAIGDSPDDARLEALRLTMHQMLQAYGPHPPESLPSDVMTSRSRFLENLQRSPEATFNNLVARAKSEAEH